LSCKGIELLLTFVKPVSYVSACHHEDQQQLVLRVSLDFSDRNTFSSVVTPQLHFAVLDTSQNVFG